MTFRGMIGAGLLALLAAGAAHGAGLSVAQDLCLARSYSEAHMAKNPAQMVTYMRLAHQPSGYTASQRTLATGSGGQYPAAFFVSVAVSFKDHAEPYSQIVECSAEGAGYRCGVECDGGAFMLSFKGNGSALVDFRQTGGMVLNSSCGEGEDHRWLGDGKSDDMLFRLDPAPLSACR